jgi:hypothetical protein
MAVSFSHGAGHGVLGAEDALAVGERGLSDCDRSSQCPAEAYANARLPRATRVRRGPDRTRPCSPSVRSCRAIRPSIRPAEMYAWASLMRFTRRGCDGPCARSRRTASPRRSRSRRRTGRPSSSRLPDCPEPSASADGLDRARGHSPRVQRRGQRWLHRLGPPTSGPAAVVAGLEVKYARLDWPTSRTAQS